MKTNMMNGLYGPSKCSIHSLLVRITFDGISLNYESGEGRVTKVT